MMFVNSSRVRSFLFNEVKIKKYLEKIPVEKSALCTEKLSENKLSQHFPKFLGFIVSIFQMNSEAKKEF